MKYEKCTSEELKRLSKKNSEEQDELAQSLSRIDDQEEELMYTLRRDREALDRLREGWTGENADKYIAQALEDDDMFQKSYMEAFSEKREQLLDRQRSLKEEEQAISEAAEAQKKEKGVRLWDESCQNQRL